MSTMLRSGVSGLRSTELRIDLSSSKIDKPYYTTLDEISGRVVFAPRTPVVVNDVFIDFIGSAKTWVDPPTPGASRMKSVNQVLILSFLQSGPVANGVLVFENERRQGFP